MGDGPAAAAFHHPPTETKIWETLPSSTRGETTNRFDLQYWEGARESALAIYDYVNERKDVPEDVRAYVTRVLKESGERKNKGFREELNMPAPTKQSQRCR